MQIDIFATSITLLFTAYHIIARRKNASSRGIKNKTSRAKISAAAILLFFGLLLHIALRWGIARYPLSEPYTVIFTLAMPLQGTDTDTLASFAKGVLLPLALFGSVCVFCLMKNPSYPCRLMCYAVFIFAIGEIFVLLPINGYITAAEDMKRPSINSAFYEKYYVPPEKVDIKFPPQKPNLIFIIGESLESSFADKTSGGLFSENHISELTKLAKANITFSHTAYNIGGGMDLFGTHWTIAAMIAKTCAVPFNLPIKGSTKFITNFLPGAVGLTDILSDQGYKQIFLCGSDKAFGSRGNFLKTHGNVEVHDLLYYKEKKKIPEDYYVFWGFEDAKLFTFAKEELDTLAAQEKPFMFCLLTADTHFPDGYTCNLCDTNHDGTQTGKTLSVFRCAAKQISDFINHIQEQQWYKDTVVVVAGDHLFMNKRVFPHDAMPADRRWLNIFINSRETPKAALNRKFSSFDMFPTILAAMGVKIEGNALGLGRSLFSSRPTIIEEIGDIDWINNELMQKSVQYDEFVYGKAGIMK